MQNATQSALNLISWHKYSGTATEKKKTKWEKKEMKLWFGICIKAKSKACTKIIRVDIFNGWGTGWTKRNKSVPFHKKSGRFLSSWVHAFSWLMQVLTTGARVCVSSSFFTQCVKVCVFVCLSVFVLNQLSLPVGKLCPAIQPANHPSSQLASQGLSSESHFELW